MGKVKKILAGVLVVVIAGSGITAGLMQLKKNSQKTVAVTPVSGLLQEFYTPSTTLDGTITSSATQTVNGDKDLIIDQIYVTKGDTVNKYKVLNITQNSVTVKLGNNTYCAGIGEILTEGSVNHNDVSNLSKKFGGERR